jgi:hypothetical protein
MTKLTIPVLGKFGVIKDIEPQELPINAWSDCINMRFTDGGVSRIKGEKKIFDTPAVIPYHLQPYTVDGVRYWVHAGLAAVYADDGTTRSNITPTSAPTGGIDDRWTGGIFNGILIANNQVDAPIFWGGTGLAATLTNWPANTIAKSVRPYKNVIVALGVTKNVGTTNDEFPHMVKWSNIADPGTLPSTWDETDVTETAGERDLAEDSSVMVDQLPLGDSNIIYKENAMYSMTPSGGQDIFRFQRLPGNVGALTQNCVVNTPLGHVVLTPGDVIIHSGQGARSIITARMRKWLFSRIDSLNRNRSFVALNPVMNEVLICFPQLGDEVCTLAVVWNWVEDNWSIRELNNATCSGAGQLNYGAANSWAAATETWDTITGAWNQDELSPAQQRMLIGSSAPLISVIDVTASFNGTPYTSFLEKTGIHLDAPDRVKLIRSIYPRIKAATGTRVQFQVGASMDVEGDITWSDPVIYTVGTTYKVDSFASGRFLAIRVQSIDNTPYEFRSMDIDYALMGGY